MDDFIIHHRIHERHPEIDNNDVRHAWENCFRSAPRIESPGEYVALGPDSNGRLLEMTAVRTDNGAWLLYHAMTPPSRKTFAELRMAKGAPYGIQN